MKQPPDAFWRFCGMFHQDIDFEVRPMTDENLMNGKTPPIGSLRDRVQIATRLALNFADREDSYRTGTVTAMALDGVAGQAANANLVLDGDGARVAAEGALSRARQQADTLEFALPPSFAALEAGDVISLEGQADGPFVVAEIRDGQFRRVTVKALAQQSAVAFQASPKRSTGLPSAVRSVPVIAGAHLPPEPGEDASRLMLGAYASPWPGEISVEDGLTGAALATLTRRECWASF